MLDVHPPHHAASTWRDFFIHIATIVIGLLIAVGLEQTVEYLHHRHEMRELREALALEREENRKALIVNFTVYRFNRAALQNDLRIFEYLRQHPGTPEETLPGVPVWPGHYQDSVKSAWNNAQQTQALTLLPRQENEDNASFYEAIAKGDETAYLNALTTLEAGSYAIVDPNPSHLAPAKVEQQIDLIRKAMFDNWGWGIWLYNLSTNYKDLGGPLTIQELEDAYGSSRSPQDRAKLAGTTAQTQQALAAARAALAAAGKSTGLH